MDREERELIHNYAKLMFINNSIDELKEYEHNVDVIEFCLDYDEERDKGITYETFLSIMQTCIFIKENYERYSIWDIDSFFSAYSFFPN
jgi:hypothetical protein